MKIQVKKLREDAVVPVYAHSGDAGMDLYSVEQVTLAPGGRAGVATGVAMSIPEGNVGLVWEKSGRAAAEGLSTMAGVIDAGYRGEIVVVLRNSGDEPIVIEPHQKIAQLLIQPVVRGEITEVQELDDTPRGDGGFGSTGL